MATALDIESVSKCFRIGTSKLLTLKESIIRRIRGAQCGNDIVWALRDITFSVEQGRSVGIIGHNGAGKSTLLRLLCGLGRPTSGRIRRMGHTNGVLELGSGFHPEMTGRENIVTAGLLNGLTRRQVRREEREIISFSELETFIDQPIRTFSTGMYLRLAFATAIHFDPDVLLIDEVLAVGDSRFRQKCVDRLTAFRKAGKTLVLASHDVSQVRTLCDEAIVLEEGRLEIRSNADAAIRCYHDVMRKRTEKRADHLGLHDVHPASGVQRGTHLGTGEAAIQALRIENDRGTATDTIESENALTIVLKYKLNADLPDFAVLLGVYHETNLKCFETTILSAKASFGSLQPEGTFRCHLPSLPLLPGRYFVDVGLYPPDWSFIYDFHWQMHVLYLVSGSEIATGTTGVVHVNPRWTAD